MFKDVIYSQYRPLLITTLPTCFDWLPGDCGGWASLRSGAGCGWQRVPVLNKRHPTLSFPTCCYCETRLFDHSTVQLHHGIPSPLYGISRSIYQHARYSSSQGQARQHVNQGKAKEQSSPPTLIVTITPLPCQRTKNQTTRNTVRVQSLVRNQALASSNEIVQQRSRGP